MVTCGHQFHMGDECDWLISSSAMCPINGNSSATNILKKLIESHCKTRNEEPRDMFNEVRGGKNDPGELDLSYYLSSGNYHSGVSHFVTESTDTKKVPELTLEAQEISLKKSKTNRSKKEYCMQEYDSEDFDENQHLDGCPIKWYYRKRTKNGWGPCIALRKNEEENCREYSRSGKKYRDRIPLEVKIGKISLNKREPLNDFRNLNGVKIKNEIQSDGEKYKKFEIDPKVMEIQKKKLEAKLNWRPFQETEEEERGVFLCPGSAVGGKSPVSILLFPYHQQNKCSCGRTGDKVPKTRLERVSSAFQTTKQPNTSEITRGTRTFRPKTSQSLRWGSKTQRKGKRLQLPKQMNVSFDGPKNSKHPAALPGIKKENEKIVRMSKRSNDEHIRNAQSLTSLYYQLEDKSNSGGVMDDEYLEKMIRELSVQDNLHGLRSILNPGFPVKKKRYKEENPPTECHYSMARWSDGDHFKIICKQVKFSQRRPKSRIMSECNAVPTVTIEKDVAN